MQGNFIFSKDSDSTINHNLLYNYLFVIEQPLHKRLFLFLYERK